MERLLGRRGLESEVDGGGRPDPLAARPGWLEADNSRSTEVQRAVARKIAEFLRNFRVVAGASKVWRRDAVDRWLALLARLASRNGFWKVGLMIERGR